MGFDRTNVYGLQHRGVATIIQHRPEGATVNTYACRLHRGDANLDTITPTEASAAQWASLKTAAAISQSAFDQAAGGVWPIWYGQRTTADKAAMRDAVANP